MNATVTAIARETTALNLVDPADAIPASVALTPMQMAYQLIAKGTDLESVKEMLAVGREIERDQARRAFDSAIAAAKARITPVIKNRDGHTGKYADFAAIAKAVDPIISEVGLSYRFRTQQADRITVTCVLSHKDGHSEETSLAGPADTSGAKNAIQAIGSTLTYLQRYTLVQALGLAAAEDDNGTAAGAAGLAINEQQRADLDKLIEATGSDPDKFLAYFKIEYLANLPSSRFAEAKRLLEQKRK